MLKLYNKTLLTVTSKSYTTSVSVTEKEIEKIKANIDSIRENMIRKQLKKSDNMEKLPKSETKKKRKTIEPVIETPSLDLRFMEHMPQYSDSQGGLIIRRFD